MADHPCTALKKIFHEPNRLAIMSALCSAREGLSFTQLKETCQLTDGNLSRHLKTLEEADVIRIQKYYTGSKPRTQARLSALGRQRFAEYLAALEKVLRQAACSVEAMEDVSSSLESPLTLRRTADA